MKCPEVKIISRQEFEDSAGKFVIDKVLPNGNLTVKAIKDDISYTMRYNMAQLSLTYNSLADVTGISRDVLYNNTRRNSSFRYNQARKLGAVFTVPVDFLTNDAPESEQHVVSQDILTDVASSAYYATPEGIASRFCRMILTNLQTKEEFEYVENILGAFYSFNKSSKKEMVEHLNIALSNPSNVDPWNKEIVDQISKEARHIINYEDRQKIYKNSKNGFDKNSGDKNV